MNRCISNTLNNINNSKSFDFGFLNDEKTTYLLNRNQSSTVFASIHTQLYSQKHYNFLLDMKVPDSDHNRDLGKKKIAIVFCSFV